MLFEHQHEYPLQSKATESIAEKLNVNHETLGQCLVGHASRYGDLR